MTDLARRSAKAAIGSWYTLQPGTFLRQIDRASCRHGADELSHQAQDAFQLDGLVRTYSIYISVVEVMLSHMVAVQERQWTI
jgi:hypothetical protein